MEVKVRCTRLRCLTLGFSQLKTGKSTFHGLNMAKIRQNQLRIENIGSKFVGLLGSLHLQYGINCSIPLTHNYLRLLPEQGL